MLSDSNSNIVNWFREASPYINAHRKKVFVVYMGGEVIEHPNFTHVISDLALLETLGIRLVIVHGVRPQIDRCLDQPSAYHSGIRITAPSEMEKIQEVVGRLNTEIQSRLSSNLTTALVSGLSKGLAKGLAKGVTNGSSQLVISGNFVKAKPLGVRDGVDFQQTGEVRKLNLEALNQQLQAGAIVLLSPLGFSPSGEVFNLESHKLAYEVATGLQADKLIYYVPVTGVVDDNGERISELLPQMIEKLEQATHGGSANEAIKELMMLAGSACLKGVNRCHLISYQDDGALLKELFTRDGTGTQISRHSYEVLRPARVEDLAGIIALIEPLEDKGILVKRSRELLESELDNFTVVELDGLVIACAALYRFKTKGELACVAIHQDYRNDGKGDMLLKSMENKARTLKLEQLFVLTTQSTHWFKERGFVEKGLENLPSDKLNLYNAQRNSKLLIKPLSLDIV